MCDTVYATTATSERDEPRTALARSDGIFSDGYDTQMATVTGSIDTGLTATLAVPV